MPSAPSANPIDPEVLLAENERLRAELRTLRSNRDQAGMQIAVAQDQVRIDRENFQRDSALVRNFMVAFTNLSNAKIRL